MKRIVVFASGSGSNAENLIQHFKNSSLARVVAIFCNNPGAGVLTRAERLGIPTFLFDKQNLQNGGDVDAELEKYTPDLIVLAGFLLLFPKRLLNKYPDIINIHPALLPNYGGKGMYGNKIHEAVLRAGETEHGVTVHFVNEHYDDGQIIIQEKFHLEKSDTIQSVESKIHEIEHRIFPKAIEMVLKSDL